MKRIWNIRYEAMFLDETMFLGSNDNAPIHVLGHTS